MASYLEALDDLARATHACHLAEHELFIQSMTNRKTPEYKLYSKRADLLRKRLAKARLAVGDAKALALHQAKASRRTASCK